ncbi:1,3-beta-glucanosyltransferase Gas5p [Trichomonascus vanleenenianus]|uniref:1,3-beta-glucanosyltransferase n=1 Tax=Trichomonascus vanleenenianus TaxID=2268995 RepID=UPI003ECBA882
MKFSTIAAGAAVAATASAALKPIEIKGNAFYPQGSDTRFYIRGVDYQPGGASKFIDPLADEDTCSRDIRYFKELGINTVRVYSVENDKSHDKCMQLLDDAGIYLILDVNNAAKNSINRANPAPSYNAAYLQTVFATIDAFKGYDNVLGFFAANEVINSANTTSAAPYVKAVVRDMKAYIKKQCKRKIPVGYSAADVSENRWEQMQYFNCGEEDDARLDMFGMNDYSWCGDSSFTVSGYSAKVKQYSNYSIPLFMSEFGCNQVRPRKFTEIEAIYSDEMSSVFSGGLVYEYSEEGSNYGLVQLDGNNVKTLQDFDTLKAMYSKVKDPSGDGGASTDKTPSTCPAYNKDEWDVKTTKLPTIPEKAKKYLESGAGKPLGTNAPFTQNGDGEKNSPFDDDDSSDVDSASSSGSSSSSSASSTHSKGAAAGVMVPSLFSSVVIAPAIVLTASFFFGAALL